MDFGVMNLKITGSLAVSTMAICLCNTGTNKIKKLVFNSFSEEHCTLKICDTENAHDDDTVPTNKE
jgi:hypothetical protein